MTTDFTTSSGTSSGTSSIDLGRVATDVAVGVARGAPADVLADWQGLAQIPQLLGNIKTGVLTMRSLVHAPQAAMASGNPMVGGAIVALGAQLAVFLYQTAQAIEDDIGAVRQVARNYRDQEDRVVRGAQDAMGDIDRCTTPYDPHLNGGLPSGGSHGSYDPPAHGGAGNMAHGPAIQIR